MENRSFKIIIYKEYISAFSLLCAWFIVSWIVYIDSTMCTQGLRLLLNSILFMSFIIAFVTISRVEITRFEISACIAVIIYRLYSIIWHASLSGIGLKIIILSLLIIRQDDFVRGLVFKWFKRLIVISCAYGIVCYASCFLPFYMPHVIIRGETPWPYMNFGITYIAQYTYAFRLCAFFNEPGFLGTFIAFFLIADRFNLKKIDNLILFIAGFLTLSLAYVILIVVYFVLLNATDYKRWIVLGGIIVLYLVVLPQVRTGNQQIDAFIQRMVITNHGLTGDNRYGRAFEQIYNSTLHSSRIWFGYGSGYSLLYGSIDGVEGLASIKQYIVDFGIVGTMIIFVPFLISSFKYALLLENNLLLIYIVASFVSLYQRPYLFWEPYYMLYLCGISYVANYNYNNYVEIDKL